MKLRWEDSPRSTWGYSGSLRAVMIVRESYMTPTWSWSIEGVFTRYICKGRGESSSLAGAKRAARGSWEKWLRHAGLQQGEDNT